MFKFHNRGASQVGRQLPCRKQAMFNRVKKTVAVSSEEVYGMGKESESRKGKVRIYILIPSDVDEEGDQSMLVAIGRGVDEGPKEVDFMLASEMAHRSSFQAEAMRLRQTLKDVESTTTVQATLRYHKRR